MTTTARAIVASEPGSDHKGGENWKLQEIQVPNDLKDGEVLIQMVASGICHTDLLITSFPAGTPGFTYPRVAGHEGSGYVKAVGPNVKKDLKVDDPVLLSFDYCRSCENCTAQRFPYCETFQPLNLVGADGVFKTKDGQPLAGKFFGHSSFASLSVVNEACVLPARDHLQGKEDLQLFAPLGCGIQTGAGAILNLAKAGKDDRVMVLGIGGVGLSAIMAAKISGAKQIIAVDRFQSRLDLAKTFGATHGVDTTGVEDLPAKFKEVAGDLGPTIVVDTTSYVPVIQAAYDGIAINGTFIVIGGGMDPNYKLNVDLVTHIMKGIKFLGCVEGNSVPDEFIPRLIKHYREGQLPIEKIAKFYKAEDFEKAVHDMHTGETIKPILLWQ